MSPWLYKCSEQAHLAHKYTLQLGYHVFFSNTHICTYTFIYQIKSVAFHGKVSCLASPHPQIHSHSKMKTLHGFSCANLATSSERLALHCLLKPILQSTISTVLQADMTCVLLYRSRCLSPWLHIVHFHDAVSLTVCCGCTVNYSLRQSHTTPLCSQSLGSCVFLARSITLTTSTFY